MHAYIYKKEKKTNQTHCADNKFDLQKFAAVY
jgi:hypothetical protein